jgi:branched-chain amino acid transport system substrate-binding protein
MFVRSIVKIGGTVLVAALALTACGGTKNADNGGGSSKTCDLKIGFFGALTGDAANLGQNIQNGVKLAVTQYNAKHADCKVSVASFDSQGDPAQAPALAKKAIDDKTVVGIVGPAFSGESKAADPAFNEAGLTTITPSATNPALSTNGWKTFFRILGNDASQGPAAAKYMSDVTKVAKPFVMDDASEYGKGLADIVKTTLGSKVVGHDEIQQKQTDFSASVTKVKASGADSLFYGGYYAEAGLLVKQLRGAGWKGVFVVGDGVKDDGFIKAAGAAAAEGAVITCPCLPPDKAPDFFTAYKTAYNAEPATYSAEGFDSANVFLDGIAAGKTTRADLLTWTASYDKQGVTKEVKFDAKGEPTTLTVWAYKVAAGKIVADQEIK